MAWSSSPAGWGVDLASQPDKTILSKGKRHTELKREGSNLIDNEGYLYFQCVKCLNIFDPQTKNFKTLNDGLDVAKWKRVWNTNRLGYKVYCTECTKETTDA